MKKKNDVVETHYGNGQLQSRANYKDGKLDDVVNRNYFANVRRLKISDKTTVSEWLAKIHEEVGELIESWDGCDSFDQVELADVTLVCFSMAKHFDINLVDEMEKKMKVNEKRKD